MKRITYFLSGALAALLISSATVSAFAAGGLITLNVQPAQVMVNGEVFQPKDAQGRDALVFTYNGTTYAPVRALAEAYGLTVGYDSAKNMATVVGAARTTNSTGSFSSQWTVTEKPVTRYGNEHIFTAVYSGPLSMDKFKSWWKSMNDADLKAQAEQMALKAQSDLLGSEITMYFSFGSYNLGTPLHNPATHSATSTPPLSGSSNSHDNTLSIMDRVLFYFRHQRQSNTPMTVAAAAVPQITRFLIFNPPPG